MGGYLRAGGVLTWVEECEVFVLGDATEEGSVVGPFQAARRALELLECGGAFLLGNIPDADCRVKAGCRHRVVGRGVELGEDQLLRVSFELCVALSNVLRDTLLRNAPQLDCAVL